MGLRSDGLSDPAAWGWAEQLFDLLEEGVVVVDGDERIQVWNAGAERTLGRQASQVVGRRIDTVFDPSSVAVVRGMLAACPATRPPVGDPSRLGPFPVSETRDAHRRPDGRRVAIEWTCYPVFHPGGEFFGLAAVVADVSAVTVADEQRAALSRLSTRALGASSAREVLDLAVATAAEALEVAYVSLLEMVLERDEFVLVATHGWEHAELGVTTIKLAEGAQSVVALTTDGPVVSENVWSDPRFNPSVLLRSFQRRVGASAMVAVRAGGRPWGVLAAHDTSNRAFTREELDVFQTIANVMATVVEREQSGRQSIDDDRQLQLEMVGKIATGVAHDLNNVLSGIDALAALAADDMEPTRELSEILGHIRAEVDIGHAIVSQVVEFTNLVASDDVPVELGEFLDELVRRLARTVPAGVSLRFRPTGQPITVAVGAVTVHRIVTNLITNAVAALSGSGTVRVEASVETVTVVTSVDRELSSGRWARIDVIDDGPGIDPDLLERVFDPTFTTKAGGMGLGLTQVLGLANRYGGRAQLERRPEGGMIASVWLPTV